MKTNHSILITALLSLCIVQQVAYGQTSKKKYQVKSNIEYGMVEVAMSPMGAEVFTPMTERDVYVQAFTEGIIPGDVSYEMFSHMNIGDKQALLAGKPMTDMEQSKADAIEVYSETNLKLKMLIEMLKDVGADPEMLDKAANLGMGKMSWGQHQTVQRLMTHQYREFVESEMVGVAPKKGHRAIVDATAGEGKMEDEPTFVSEGQTYAISSRNVFAGGLK